MRGVRGAISPHQLQLLDIRRDQVVVLKYFIVFPCRPFIKEFPSALVVQGIGVATVPLKVQTFIQC